jgi:hypothetical protein
MRSTRWWCGTVLAASMAGGAEPALAQSKLTAVPAASAPAAGEVSVTPLVRSAETGPATRKPALQIWATPENLLPSWARRPEATQPVVKAPAPAPLVLAPTAPASQPKITLQEQPTAARAKPTPPPITKAGPGQAYESRGLVLLEERPLPARKPAATPLPAAKQTPHRDEHVVPVAAITAPAVTTIAKTPAPRIMQADVQTFPLFAPVSPVAPAAKPAAPKITQPSQEVIRPLAASTPPVKPDTIKLTPPVERIAPVAPPREKIAALAPPRAKVAAVAPPIMAPAPALNKTPPPAKKTPPSPPVPTARLSVPTVTSVDSTEDQIVKAIRQACSKARDVRVMVTGVNEMRIEVDAASLDDANILAGQIFALPELDPYGERVNLQIHVPEP